MPQSDADPPPLTTTASAAEEHVIELRDVIWKGALEQEQQAKLQPGTRAILSHWLRPRVTVRLLPLATRVQMRSLGRGVFFLCMVCQTSCWPETVEVGDTDHLPELLLYLLLNYTPPGLWCLAPSGFQEVQDWFARFGGMPVSSIQQCSIASSAIRLPPAVGCRATGLDSCVISGFLPGLSSLHQFHYLLFCAFSLLVIHVWPPFSFVTVVRPNGSKWWSRM